MKFASCISRYAFFASGAVCATAGRARAAALFPLNLEVGNHPGLEYGLPVVIAQQLGIAAKEGIDIRSITGSVGGGTEVRGLISGDLNLGLTAMPAVIRAIMTGEDLKIVAGGAQTPGTQCWVVKKDSPVKTIHDFVGKRVGFTAPGSGSETSLLLCLQAAKMDPASVKMTSGGGVGGNLTLLNTGGLDVAFSIYPTLAHYIDDLRVVFYARDFLPHFMQNVWFAPTSMIKQHRDAVAGFIRAWGLATDYIASHPLQAAHIYAQATAQDENAFALTLAKDKPGEFFGQGQLTLDGLMLGREGHASCQTDRSPEKHQPRGDVRPERNPREVSHLDPERRVAGPHQRALGIGKPSSKLAGSFAGGSIPASSHMASTCRECCALCQVTRSNQPCMVLVPPSSPAQVQHPRPRLGGLGRVPGGKFAAHLRTIRSDLRRGLHGIGDRQIALCAVCEPSSASMNSSAIENTWWASWRMSRELPARDGHRDLPAGNPRTVCSLRSRISESFA